MHGIHQIGACKPCYGQVAPVQEREMPKTSKLNWSLVLPSSSEPTLRKKSKVLSVTSGSKKEMETIQNNRLPNGGSIIRKPSGLSEIQTFRSIMDYR